MKLRIWLATMFLFTTLTAGGASSVLAIEEDDGVVVVVDKYGNTAEVSPGEQVKICHVSTGNLKIQTKEVGGPAVQAHIIEHGDTLFSEVYGCDAPPEDEPTPET